ncbi:MAG TPA: helix-turn-helix domain-containing protein [Tepidisphaeraceae bacterium]|jgi:AraC-like DNA-binding protein
MTSNPNIVHLDAPYAESGFGFYAGPSVAFSQMHRHNELELGVVQRGRVTALFGQRRMVLPPNHLLMFWAAMPHGPVESAPQTHVYSIFVPMRWFLDWRLPAEVMHPLLAGEVLVDEPRRVPCTDVRLMQHWVERMREGSESSRQLVLREIEARLWRLALDRKPEKPFRPSVAPAGDLPAFERMALLIAKHCREPLSVEDIAEAVDLDPAYAMRLFRKVTGTTLHQYLIQHRVSHAQRLLATTDLDMLAVAEQSGFAAPSRFFEQFRRVVGHTPAAYRASLRK